MLRFVTMPPWAKPSLGDEDPLGLVLAVFAVVLMSNTWLSWESGIQLLHAVDVYSYEIIARSAPGLPSATDGEMSFQYGQRFLFHYLIGIVANLTSLPLPLVYRGCLLAVLVLLLIAVTRIVGAIGVSGFRASICVLLVVVNPYVLRYYLVAPGMIVDVIFALCLALTILGALRKQIAIVLCGALFATFARQTQVLALPGLVLWMIAAANWRDDALPRKIAHITMLVGVHALAYVVASTIAGRFTHPVVDFHLYYSAYTYIALDLDRLLALAEHGLRTGIPHLMGFLLLAVAYANVRKKMNWRSLPAELWACVIIVVSLASQPLLMEPEYANQGQARHSSLGLVAGVTALALFFKQCELHLRFRFTRRMGLLLVALLFASSFHHKTSVSPLATPVQYAAYHFLIAGLCALTFRRMLADDS